MSFKKFKDWIENNKWTSFLLIVLFLFGFIFQVTDTILKTRILIFDDSDFKIVSIDVSRKYSVYRDIDKVNKRLRPFLSRTQFENKKYRQIVRDTKFVDRLGEKISKELLTTTLMIMAYALDYADDLHPTAKEIFTKFDESSYGSLELYNFVFSMIPSSRFIHNFEELNPSPYVMFLPDKNEATKAFQKALDSMWSAGGMQTYRIRKKIIKRSTVEAYFEEYHSIFKLGFFPVFELTLFNNGSKNLMVSEVGAEVMDIGEYMGGGEHIPTSKVISLPIAYKKGENWKSLNDPLILKKGDYLRLLIRLEPQNKESSYLIKLKVKANDIIRETEVIAVDM